MLPEPTQRPFDAPSRPATRRFDVCVVGAGPAGTAAAYLLDRQGRSVALVDRARFPRDKTCGDGITPRGARVLARIGVLDAVRHAGYACHGVDVRGEGSDGDTVTFTMRFDRARDGDPSDLIVLPRLKLDALLLDHALRRGHGAGPTYFGETKIVDVRASVDGEAAVALADDGTAIEASMMILATGAESQLLRAAGLLEQKPPLEHAARAYFENVEGLTDRIVLFFDGVDLPGYGWIFPTSPTSANIGCGVFAQDIAAAGRGPKPMLQTQRLERLVAEHPLLSRMLRRATRSGPIRAYPLRTDFCPRFAGEGRMVVIGEAAGLVNPITGEGIDYALESAEFVAEAFARRWTGATVNDAMASAILEDYRARLGRRFSTRFRLYRSIQRYALSPSSFPALITQVRRAPRLQRLVVDGLFGRMRPAHLLKPATLWEIARTLMRTGLRTPMTTSQARVRA